MSLPFRPWNPITAARAKDLNLGEDIGDLYLRFGINPKDVNTPAILEAAQRRHIPPLLQGHLDRWEMRATVELDAMHSVGVRVDRKQASRLEASLDGMVQTLERRLAQEFKIDKPMCDIAVRQWLLKNGLPLNGSKEKMDDHLKTIESRKPRGDDDPVLLVHIIRRYRRLHAIRDQHPWLLIADERIHPQHHHLCQTTGRTTTKNPAVTGIPKEMRPLIIASEGFELFEIDYVSMEVGVAAGLSGDAGLLAAYRSGNALSSLARIIFPNELQDVAVDDVERLHKDLRTATKPIVYGTLYGQAPHGLSKRTGMKEPDAKDLQDRLFGSCFSYKAMVEASQRHVARTSTVVLGCGFERRIPDTEKDYRFKTIAANARVQTGAGIIFRMASVLAGPRLRAIGARLILPIHDAYVCEAPTCRRQQAIAILSRAMEIASLVFFHGRVRLRVSVNDANPHFWNKDGHGDSLDNMITNPAFRL